jgi:hypothetical protein
MIWISRLIRDMENRKSDDCAQLTTWSEDANILWQSSLLPVIGRLSFRVTTDRRPLLQNFPRALGIPGLVQASHPSFSSPYPNSLLSSTPLYNHGVCAQVLQSNKTKCQNIRGHERSMPCWQGYFMNTSPSIRRSKPLDVKLYWSMTPRARGVIYF